jgi:hypothetical protein
VDLNSNTSLRYQYSQLACRCVSAGKEVTLLLKNNRDELEGRMRTESGRYVVSPLYELEDGYTSDTPVGYRADNACCGSPLGAVEVLHPGRIWLAQQASEAERAQASCLFAGLMLFKPETE